MPVFGPTNDHQEIRSWAAVQGAVPMQVATKVFDGEPTKLGFFFANGVQIDPEFKPVTWETFFALFDLMNLAFVYDEAKPDSYELLQSNAKLQAGLAVGPS